MSIRNLILLSQLNPPAQRTRVLNRERINTAISPALKFPITIVEAGTGYGKSTAIRSFISVVDIPVYWFTISGTDRDPRLFLAKLFTLFNQHGESIGHEALRILEMPDATQQEAMIAFLNAITTTIEEETLVVLDDVHRVCDVSEIMNQINWMVENLPPNLHVIIASRYRLEFPSINKWRVKFAVLEISRDVLAFTKSEIEQLFKYQYGISLSDLMVNQLFEKTEGWAIGLQMVWQTLQNNPEMNLEQILTDNRQSRIALFDYLAEEVLGGLDSEIQDFLLQTSILSKLDSATCDFLLNIEDSDRILNHLQQVGLFLEELRPGVYRYHQIFREFINNRLMQNPARAKELHLKIASYFRAHEYWEEAIFHLLSAGDYQQTNQLLEIIGEIMIREGRHESINYWIHEIPESARQNYPYLLFLLGEVNRYLGQFEEALEHYHSAERKYRKQNHNPGISMALRGQAQVFLDTIRPINADQLLQDALRLLDPSEMRHEVADLLVLTAENQLNLGLPDSAESLLAQAKNLRPELGKEADLIQARVYLRTGRLQQGINLLHDREASNPNLPIARPQRFHRESTLLLSLYYSIIGDIDEAERYARQGIEIGRLLQSSFVQSVGFMRLGHALLLRSKFPFNENSFEQAMQYFQESIDKIDVTRIHVEPLWGMCRALGYTGHLKEAEELALESLAIAKKAGDEWISVLIQLSLGAGAVLTGNYEAAQQYLTTAETSSVKVNDPFTLCAARLWLAIKAWQQGYENTAFAYLEKILPVIDANQYNFLITQESLMGLKDRETIIPLLLAASENNIEKTIIKKLLKNRWSETLTYHPGYSLWVQTFGNFKVWRGDQAIDAQDWKRGKSRFLFQLLVAHRDKWLHRDQIIAMLWTEDSHLENAVNYFKVILNGLNQTLEPDRPKGETSFFIERKQESYRLNPKAMIIVDTDIFVEEINKDAVSSLEYGINLYQGHYFADSYVQEWLMIEDQYYHQQFLMASEKLIDKLIETKDFEKALAVTYRILTKDNLWESAYRKQMSIFHEMGQHAMVGKVFQQCQNVFLEQLDSPVSQITINHYEKLTTEKN